MAMYPVSTCVPEGLLSHKQHEAFYVNTVYCLRCSMWILGLTIAAGRASSKCPSAAHRRFLAVFSKAVLAGLQVQTGLP